VFLTPFRVPIEDVNGNTLFNSCSVISSSPRQWAHSFQSQYGLLHIISAQGGKNYKTTTFEMNQQTGHSNNTEGSLKILFWQKQVFCLIDCLNCLFSRAASMHYMSHMCDMTHSFVASTHDDTGWLRLVGSIKLFVSFAKEPYRRDDILQKRPVILSILLTVATPYHSRKRLDLKYLDLQIPPKDGIFALWRSTNG